MLTNKEIRALPMPKINSGTRTLALQNTKDDVFVITCGKIKSSVVINAFSKDGDGGVTLLYRYFIKQHNALLYNVKTNKITKGYLSNSLWHGTMASTGKEAAKLKRYISPDSDKSAVGDIICTYDSWRSVKRSQIRRKQKTDETDRIMHKVRKAPKSFETTIRNTMAYSKYIFFNRNDNRGTCSCCGNTMELPELPKFRDKDYGKCPRCREKIRFRSETRRRLYRMCDTGMAVLIQKYDYHVLIARYFHIAYDYTSSPVPEITVQEVTRTLIDYDRHSVRDYEWYYYDGALRWCVPQISMYNPSGLHHPFLKGSLHKAGLQKELRAAGVDKYLEGREKIEECLRRDSADSCYLHVKYLECLAVHPVLEQMTKRGLYNLVSDYSQNKINYMNRQVDKNARSIVRILNLKNRTQLREAIALNINSDEMDIIQQYNNATDTDRPIRDIFKIADEYGIRKEDAFALSDSRLRKLTKYLDSLNYKESERDNLIIDYFDYLRNCESLNYAMTSETVLYPKDFKKAHDEAMVNIKSRKLEKECEVINRLLPDMHNKYDFSSDTLMIKAPDSGRDIIYEGQILHHCVSSYIPRVAKGETVILFIRKKKAPDKPYVTVEVKSDKIMQVRGFDNGRPEPDVSEFVEQFKLAKHIA